MEKNKHFLQESKNILVLQAEKCNNSILMNKTDYERKMNDLLNDTSIYKTENTNLTVKVQQSVNNVVLEKF